MSQIIDYRQFTGYLGNPRLRRANMDLPITEEQLEEIRKCVDDPVYFACNYIKIVHVDRGLVPFEMWDFQKDMIRQFHNERFNIVKTARQVGKSTITVAYILHNILFNKYRRVAILANKGSTSRELMSRLQLAYENLPPWLQQGIITWNKGDIELENGSIVLAAATTSSAVRGYSFTLLFMDEFAFVPTNIADEFFTSTYPTISSGKETKVIIVSTPNGMNHFHERWVKAEKGESEFKTFSVHWSSVPGRDEKWKQETIKNTSETQFQQEMEAEFLGSSATLISARKLKELHWAATDPVKFEQSIYVQDSSINAKHKTNGFSIYEDPIEGHTYCLTADVSRGQGNDYSAIAVIDITEIPYKVVAKFRDNFIPTLVFPTMIYTIAQRYNEAFVLVELNDVGQQVAETLHYEFAYENLIKVEARPKLGQIISAGFQKRMQLGLKTSVATKKIGCANLKALIESDKLLIKDHEIIRELTNFIAQQNTYKAEVGSHDDLAMTLVLFGWVINQRFFKDSIGSNIRKNIQEEQMKLMDDDIIPTIVFDDGTEETFMDDEKVEWFKDRKNKYIWDDIPNPLHQKFFD